MSQRHAATAVHCVTRTFMATDAFISGLNRQEERSRDQADPIWI
jgi:hypothetical protein